VKTPTAFWVIPVLAIIALAAFSVWGSQGARRQDAISVSGLTLCSSNCVYPAPYVSALVYFNGSSPASTLSVYVNNTFDGLALGQESTTYQCTGPAGGTCSIQLGGQAFSNASTTLVTRYYASCVVPANTSSCTATVTGASNTLTEFALQWKGSVPSGLIPIVKGDSYIFKFVAVFQDGTTVTRTSTVVAH
jgi:hypothetical protein